jgi:hypothetical protein
VVVEFGVVLGNVPGLVVPGVGGVPPGIVEPGVIPPGLFVVGPVIGGVVVVPLVLLPVPTVPEVELGSLIVPPVDGVHGFVVLMLPFVPAVVPLAVPVPVVVVPEVVVLALPVLVVAAVPDVVFVLGTPPVGGVVPGAALLVFVLALVPGAQGVAVPAAPLVVPLGV